MGETKEKLKCDRVRVLEIEGGFKEFRSELDGLYKETKELRMKLKAEKDRHKVEMEEMMTHFGETEFTCKLKRPTAVTLSLSAAKKEPVIKDSSPSQNNRSRKRTRKKDVMSGMMRRKNYVKSIKRIKMF